MWSTGRGNGKLLQYFCLQNPMNSMKRQKDMTPEDEPPGQKVSHVLPEKNRGQLVTAPERMKIKILASKDKPNEDVGCFVEYAPGKEGMVHISKICEKRINKVTDAGIDVGSAVRIKYMGLDKKGRMDFSIRDAKEN